MSYKTIVVHVDDSRNADARIESAATIAVLENAHLIGAAMTGVYKSLYETLATNPEDPVIAPYFHALRERAKNSLTKFEDIAQRAGVASFETRLVEGEIAKAFRLQALCCDLVVLGRYDRDDPFSTLNSDLSAYAVTEGGSPALIMPKSHASSSAIDRVLIAWNGSGQAMRAVRGALPLIKRAKVVEVALFLPPSEPKSKAMVAGDDFAGYLARHGVSTEIIRRERNETASGDIGVSLLALAVERSSDLLVMGCYGHSRFFEMLLGGATRVVLEEMNIPVLMAH